MSWFCTHQLLDTYVFEGIICIAQGKNGKENMECLKTVQLSTVVVTLLYSIFRDNLPDKGLTLLDFLAFIAENQNYSKFQLFQYFNNILSHIWCIHATPRFYLCFVIIRFYHE